MAAESFYVHFSLQNGNFVENFQQPYPSQTFQNGTFQEVFTQTRRKNYEE